MFDISLIIVQDWLWILGDIFLHFVVTAQLNLNSTSTQVGVTT